MSLNVSILSAAGAPDQKFEIAQVLVGPKGKEWWQQREEVAFPMPVLPAPSTEPDPASSTAMSPQPIAIKSTGLVTRSTGPSVDARWGGGYKR